MPKRVKQYGLLLVGVGVALAVIVPAVVAQTGDTDDYIAPVSTLIHGNLKAGTKLTFVAPVPGYTGVAVTQTCTASSTHGTTPAHGLSTVIAPVSFTGCTDSLGGNDTVKTNSTNGKWRVTGIDAPNDETTEPPPGASSGDKVSITVPIKGATVTSTAVAGCVITVAPTAAAHTVGAYNDTNTATIKTAPVPVQFSSACPGGGGNSTAHFTGTYIFTPGVHDAS